VAKKHKPAPAEPELNDNEFKVGNGVIGATVVEDPSHNGSGMQVLVNIDKVANTGKAGETGEYVWKRSILGHVKKAFPGWGQVNVNGSTITCKNAAGDICNISKIEAGSTLTVKSGRLHNAYYAGSQQLTGIGNLGPNMTRGETYRCPGCHIEFPVGTHGKTRKIGCNRRRLIDRIIRASLSCQTS